MSKETCIRGKRGLQLLGVPEMRRVYAQLAQAHEKLVGAQIPVPIHVEIRICIIYA